MRRIVSKLVALLLAVVMCGAMLPAGTAISVTKEIWGDANGDGKINSSDIIRVKNYLAHYDYVRNVSSYSIASGTDSNGDKKVNSSDIIRLKNYLAHYNYTYGTSSYGLGPGSDLRVVDAVNYSKKSIIYYAELGDVGWTHRVVYPKLSGATANQKAFNQKISNRYSGVYESLMRNEEKNYLFDISYVAYFENGLIGIAVRYVFAEQFSEGSESWDLYYYDAVNDREITESAYISMMGLGDSAADQKIRATAAFKAFQQSYKESTGSAYNGSFLHYLGNFDHYFAIYSAPEMAYVTEMELYGSWQLYS